MYTRILKLHVRTGIDGPKVLYIPTLSKGAVPVTTRGWSRYHRTYPGRPSRPCFKANRYRFVLEETSNRMEVPKTVVLVSAG